MADDVQSPAGDQGAEVTDSGLFPDLDSVAPEIREPLGEYVKKVQGNVDARFREAADFRKSWEPYEELGVKDLDPAQLKGLLDFAQMAQDETQFNEWLKNAATERGLLSREEPGDLGLEEEFDQDKIQSLIAEKVTEAIGPIQEKFQAQEKERMEAQANQEITEQLEQIRKDNPDLPEGAEDAIVRLAYSYADEESDPIAKGFEDYQALIGQGEKSLFAKKEDQPKAPEGPGAPSTSPEVITSFNDPRLKAQARERLAQSQ